MLKKILEFQNRMRKAIKNKYLPCIDVNTIWSNLWSFQKDAELREETCALLKMAATHSTEAHKVGGAFGGEDAHYFLDLDMAVLGSSPDSYAEYRERIRGEYSFLSEPMYTALRLKVITLHNRKMQLIKSLREFQSQKNCRKMNLDRNRNIEI